MTNEQVYKRALEMAARIISEQAHECGYNDACPFYEIVECKYKCFGCTVISDNFIRLAKSEKGKGGGK